MSTLNSALSTLRRLMPGTHSKRRNQAAYATAVAEICEPRLLMSASQADTAAPVDESVETLESGTNTPADEPEDAASDQLAVQELDQTYQFHQTGNLWENWGGQNEKWFQDNDRAWYFMTEDGEILRWHGGDITNSTSIGFVDPQCCHDITMLTAANDANVVPAADNVMELENGDILF